MRPGSSAITDFQGVAKDIHPARLPGELFQEDVGGTRFKRGTWRRRKGMRHTSVAKQGNRVDSILGFELPGEGFALIVSGEGQVDGFTNVTEQTWP